jgi:hypothetical protein
VPTHDTDFNENVFGEAKKTNEIPPSQPHSPTAGPSRLVRSPDSSESPARIPLERVDIAADDNDDVEELMSASSSASGSITPSATRTRFITFAPTDTQADLRASISTVVPTHSRETSRQLRPRHYRRRGSSEEDEAYPDPYGISHDRSRQPSANTSRSSARSSPHIAPNSRVSVIRGSPVILPSRDSRDFTASGSGTGSGRPSLAGSQRPSLADSARPSGKKDKSGLVPTTRGWMDPIALAEYKKVRGEPILQWWRSYVDDVSQ